AEARPLPRPFNLRRRLEWGTDAPSLTSPPRSASERPSRMTRISRRFDALRVWHRGCVPGSRAAGRVKGSRPTNRHLSRVGSGGHMSNEEGNMRRSRKWVLLVAALSAGIAVGLAAGPLDAQQKNVLVAKKV